MSTPARLYSLEEYLEIDRQAERPWEFLNGEICERDGRSVAHCLITTNLVGAFHTFLRDRDCFAAMSRLRVFAAGAYLYPDFLVACGPRNFIDEQDTLANPTLICEITSPFTEEQDRGPKFAAYQATESVRDLMLIASDRVLVEVFSRQPDGTWKQASSSDRAGAIELPSIGMRLSLMDVYHNVD